MLRLDCQNAPEASGSSNLHFAARTDRSMFRLPCHKEPDHGLCRPYDCRRRPEDKPRCPNHVSGCFLEACHRRPLNPHLTRSAGCPPFPSDTRSPVTGSLTLSTRRLKSTSPRELLWLSTVGPWSYTLGRFNPSRTATAGVLGSHGVAWLGPGCRVAETTLRDTSASRSPAQPLNPSTECADIPLWEAGGSVFNPRAIGAPASVSNHPGGSRGRRE